MESLETKIDSLKGDIDKIIFYMHNDGATGKKGFIQKLEEVDRVLSDLLVREKIYQAKATVWGIVGGALVAGVIKIVALILPFLR